MGIQRVKSKWEKTNALLRSDSLSSHIPKTVKWSRSGLKAMLNEYGMVYVKPDQGTFGIGVIRIEKKQDDHYAFQHGTTRQVFSSFEQMADQLMRLIGNRPYLAQRGIELLTYDKRRFDIRIMVQQNLQQAWETTGIIGRLSHPKKIVTNYHSGGTPMPFEKLMSSHVLASEIAAYKKRMYALGVSVASQLQKSYPRLKEIGIDVAIDTSLHPWILEVNTLPDPFIFRKLPDKKVFRKMFKYCKAYGRFKAK